MGRSKDVDAWFVRYDNPMKDVVLRVREIVLGADARVEECIKWQAPTFTYRGNLASFFPKSKQHASLMFHVGAKIPGNHHAARGIGRHEPRDEDRQRGRGRRGQVRSRTHRSRVVRVARRGSRRQSRAGGEEARGAREAEGVTMPSWNKISPEQAARFEAALPDGVERRSMFGCPIAVVNGNMFTGVHNDEINVRLSPPHREQFLRDYEGARIFSPMKGMEMKEYVVVPPSVAKQPKLLASWIRKGFEFASSLPPKKAKAKKAAKKAAAKKKTHARA
jgi:TfoX/Sxy family transcriptional regulator of competence genes